MSGVFLVFNFLEHFLLSHYARSLNIEGQIYVMPDCMTGLDTVTLNNAFEHTQYRTICAMVMTMLMML